MRTAFPNENAHRDENRLHPSPYTDYIRLLFRQTTNDSCSSNRAMATGSAADDISRSAYYQSPEPKLMMFEIRGVCNLC